MKFNFRKVASVITSAVLLGSTVGIAVAANYPAPFVTGGTANVGVVVGATAASSDYLAAVDLGQGLQAELAKQTATTTTTGAAAAGGDSVNLATSARKIYYGDSINAGRSALSSSELPSVLGDGKVVDLRGTEYTYNQQIKPGSTASVFGTSGGDLNDPVLYLDAGSDATVPLYNYTLSLSKNLNVSDDTNVQGQKIKILGVDYVIGASSTNTTIYLYGAGETITLVGGESKTVTIAGKEHTIELVSTSSTTLAKLTVDGISKTVTKGSSYAYAGDLNVYVKDITHPAYAGDVRNAEIIMGANTLKIANGASVKQGADETTIKGTTATVSAAGLGFISGFTVGIAMAKTQTDHIGIGGSFDDPVFGGLKVQFAGAVPSLDDTSRANIKIDTDNNQYAYITFTSARAGTKGEQKLTYVYDNNTAATAVSPLLAHQTLAANKGHIHIYEGASALVNDWIVINQGDAGTILNVDDISIDTATSGTVTFSDVITGESQKLTLTNTSGTYLKTGVNFYGGNGYTVSINNAATATNITWSAANTRTLFPRIKLKDGGWVALLTQTTVANGTSIILPDGLTTITTSGQLVSNQTGGVMVNGINWTFASGGTAATSNITNISNANANCNFGITVGPSILYLEPKKWDDASYGNFICVPLTTTGTTEIAIGNPVFNGTSSGYTTYGSDTYKQAAVDKYGAFVTKEDRTNENGVATLSIPSSQMYLDIFFTATAVTVTPGAVGVGQVTELGSVTVKDSEVSSVQDKNLIVVGGSCINTVAAKLLGSDTPLCGESFTTKTGVGDGQYLIQTFESPYSATKVAMLVAGYEAADTKNAVTALVKEGATKIDTTKGKKYTGTTTTDVTEVVTAA